MAVFVPPRRQLLALLRAQDLRGLAEGPSTPRARSIEQVHSRLANALELGRFTVSFARPRNPLDACCYGENSMTRETADKLRSVLDLGSDVRDALLDFPLKGNGLEGKLVPTDPLLYRFYEILCVYGKSLKDSIQEKCGDGIMSAIDFTIDLKKVEHPKGDRIVVTMDGKFLAYRRF